MFAKWENGELIAGPQSKPTSGDWLEVIDEVLDYDFRALHKKLRLVDDHLEYYLEPFDYDFSTENRQTRNELLSETDWTQVEDSQLSASKKQDYKDYRQSLRDITSHENWPNLTDEDWPILP